MLRRVALAGLAALAVTACSSDPEPARVDDVLDAQAEAQASLRQRVDELEKTVDDAGQDRSGEKALSAVDELRERLDGVRGDLDGLGARLDEESTAREEAAANAETGLSDVRGGLNGLRDRVSELEAQLADLDAVIEALRDRLDKHQRQPGHG